jgi:hypothetical protein
MYNSFPADEVPIGATWRCSSGLRRALVYKKSQRRRPAATAHSVTFCSPSRRAPVCPRPWLLGNFLKNPDCGALDRGRSVHRAYTEPRSLSGHPLPRCSSARAVAPVETAHLDDTECRRRSASCQAPKGLLEELSRGAHRLAENRKQRERERCCRGPMWSLYQTDPGATGGGPLAIGRGWPRVAPYRSKLETRCGGIPMNSCAKTLNLSTWPSRRPGPIETARCSGSCLLAPVARPFEATALPSPSTTARIVFLS